MKYLALIEMQRLRIYERRKCIPYPVCLLHQYVEENRIF